LQHANWHFATALPPVKGPPSFWLSSVGSPRLGPCQRRNCTPPCAAAPNGHRNLARLAKGRILMHRKGGLWRRGRAGPSQKGAGGSVLRARLRRHREARCPRASSGGLRRASWRLAPKTPKLRFPGLLVSLIAIATGDIGKWPKGGWVGNFEKCVHPAQPGPGGVDCYW
jgi:hypothetical protein